MTDTQRTTHLEMALLYVREYGWRVFPVHGVEYDAAGQLVCTCGAGEGCQPSNRGKHPATPQGFKDAVGRDTESWEARLRAWWTARPNANIGVATGRGSGIFVVDVDVKHGDGPASLATWWAQVNEKPWVGTLAERSGTGGQHYFFAYPSDGLAVPTRVGWLDSVDIRSDGGYVVVAPSRIPAGVYGWTTSGVAPQPASSALLEAIRSGSGSSGLRTTTTMSVEDLDFLNGRVPEGSRNDAFFNRALVWLRKYQGDQNIVLGLLQVAWERLPVGSRETFTAEEVIKTFRSAWEFYNKQQAEDVITDTWIQNYMSGQTELPPPEPLQITEVEGGLITAPDGFPLTDLGNSQRLVAVYGPHIRHTTGLGWLHWDGSRWDRSGADKALERYAAAVARSMLVDFVPKLKERDVSDDVIKRVMYWWRLSESSGRLRSMVQLSEQRVDRRAGDWDTEPWLLNVTNGTVDLRTGQLRSHSPEDYLTKMSGAWWNDDAVCPSWERFLAQMVPDGEVRRYLQKAVGYSLTGSVDEKCFFILHGPGNNGKTMFTQTIGMLMGEYWSAAPKSVFIGYNTKNDQHPTDLAGVAGARFVTSAEEVTKSDHLAEARIKSMTGGNTMKARFMHQDFFEFDFMGKLWLDTNYRPRLSDFSDALQERIRLIPWDVTIPEGERRGRESMMAEFRSELPGILLWAVEGCRMWQEEGLTQPEVVRAATREYVHEENLVAQFIEDCTTPGGFAPTALLVAMYKMWLVQQGHDTRFAMSARTLGKEMMQLGVVAGRGTKGERGWCITLNQVPTSWT